MTATLHYDSITKSRKDLPQVFDHAQQGLMVNLARSRSQRHKQEGSVSVVKTSVLATILKTVVRDRIEATHTDAYTVAVAGMPLAAEGLTLADAIDDLVDDIRFYCDRWVDRYHNVPNHEGNVALVYLAQSMDDSELAAWLESEASKRLA